MGKIYKTDCNIVFYPFIFVDLKPLINASCNFKSSLHKKESSNKFVINMFVNIAWLCCL